MAKQIIPIIGSRFPGVVCPLIEQALLSIDILIYDWRMYTGNDEHPVEKINGALKIAAARAVKVRALVNNETLKAKLEELGIEAKKTNSSKMLHCKLMIIDGKKIIIGSHNYTQSAMQANEEASIFVEMDDAENDFVTFFSSLWSGQ